MWNSAEAVKIDTWTRDCPVPDGYSGFLRRDKLLKHLKERHRFEGDKAQELASVEEPCPRPFVRFQVDPSTKHSRRNNYMEISIRDSDGHYYYYDVKKTVLNDPSIPAPTSSQASIAGAQNS